MPLQTTWRKELASVARSELLDATKWGADLEWKQIELLAQSFEVFAVPDGSELFREGQQESYLGLIAAGSVAILKADGAGKLKEVTTLRAGQAFGEMALVDGSPRSAAARSVGETTLLVLSRESFDKLAKNNPQLAVLVMTKLAKALSQRLRRTSGLLVEFLEQ